MLSIAKLGIATAQASQSRAVLFRNQGNTVYDIYKIHWNYISGDALSTNDVVAMCLSTRRQDQADDDGIVGFDRMMTANGLFAVYGLNIDMITEGAIAVVNAPDIDFPLKPYTVPFCAWITNIAVAVQARIGVEVYYERKTVSAREKAAIVSLTGGLTETS